MKKRITILFDRLLENSISEDELNELLSYTQEPDLGEEVKKMMEAKWEEIGKGEYEYISSEDADNRFLKILEKAGIKKRIHENPKVKRSEERRVGKESR